MQNPGNPFVVPGMDPQLAEIISIHRGLTGGFTMSVAAPEAGQQGTQAGQDTAQGSGEQQAADAGTAGQQVAAQQRAQETDADKITRLTAELASARQEAGKDRVNAKQAAADAARNELVQQLGKALGLVKDDTPADPKELQAQIASVGTENASLKAAAQAAETRQAALVAAIGKGANPVALLDSFNFLKSIEGLAPTDTEKINAAIDTAITNNPTLKAAQAAGKSGPEMAGGSGAQGKPTTLEDAIAAKLGAPTT